MAGPLQRSTAVAAGGAGDKPDRYGHVGRQPTAYTAVFAPLFGVYIAYILTTYSAFVYRAKYLRDKSLLERSVFLLSAHTIGGALFASSALIHGFSSNYPCFIDFWMLTVGYFLWFTTIVLYMARYYVIVRFHASIETEQRVNPVTPDNLVGYMERLRMATQGVLWQSTADFDTVASPDQLPVDAQISGGRPSIIGRVLSWRRHEAVAAGAVLSDDSMVCQQGRGQSTFNRGLEGTADEVALEVSLSDNERTDIAISSDCLPQKTAKVAGALHGIERFNDKWVRRCQSNRFASYVLLGVLVATIAYLALLSSLFTWLKLGHIYYNCFSGHEYIAQDVVTGVFNVIVNPVYMVIIWRYHDAYGIRNLMCFSCAMGVVFWGAALTWRLNRRWSNIFVSGYVVYIAQMVFVYSCYVVILLMNSIWFSYAQRRIALSLGQDIEQGSARYDPDDLFHTTNDSVKREFLDDMQHAERHREVTRFAALCFCMELVSFIDVFQAFKGRVYQEMMASISQPLSSTPLVDSADSGAISELQSIANSASTQSTSHQLAGVRSINSKDLTAHSSKLRAAALPRTSVVLSGRNLVQVIFNQDSLKAVLRSKHKTPSQPNKQSADATPQTSTNLQSLVMGIAKTMAQAFPDQGIGSYMEFSESLREPLCALINTFILPESPLALNVTSNIVSAAHLYLGGGSITYSIVDQVAREAINSLYSNVYVRYHQLRK